MIRSWMLGGLCGLLLCSAVCADSGTVKTRNGQTFTGEISLDGDQVVVERKGIKTTIAREDIAAITYNVSIEQEYRLRHQKLSRYDVKGRLELAQWLLEKKQYSLAQDVTNEALNIQPHNPDIREMLRTIDRQADLDARVARRRGPVQVATTETPAPPPPASAPASQPAATGTRLLTPTEINYVRQEEWRGEGDPVPIRFQGDVLRQFLRQERVTDAGAFNRLTSAQKALLIFDSDRQRKTDLRKDVIFSDPPVMRQFKTVQRSLIANCAACHTMGKTTSSFALHWPANTDAETYTNFIILAKYSYKKDDRTYLMLDRDHPDNSLLLQFALPKNLAGQDMAHPPVQNYKGVVRSVSDNRLRMARDWIASLKIDNPPDYGWIDLSANPTK